LDGVDFINPTRQRGKVGVDVASLTLWVDKTSKVWRLPLPIKKTIMRNLLLSLWHRGFIGTFLTGLFALLPLVVTLWIMNWVAGILRGVVGPDSLLGQGLRNVGMHFAANQ